MAVGVLWVAGAFVDGTGRYVLWLVALALDYCAPFVTYWVPGRRRLAPETWNVGTEHFAERFGLFIILVLVLAPIIYIVLKQVMPGTKGEQKDEGDKLKTRY